jgi:peptide deformylase
VTERQIRLFGDPVLKAVSEPIGSIDAGVRGLVDDLLDSVRPPGRAGVAAPQIGVGLRAFSYNVDGEIGYILDPEIVELSGEPELIDEGCLSVPGLWFPTMRYPFARVSGVMAQAIQHEVDHLNGLLYLDRLDKENRRQAMKQVRESSWF